MTNAFTYTQEQEFRKRAKRELDYENLQQKARAVLAEYDADTQRAISYAMEEMRAVLEQGNKIKTEMVDPGYYRTSSTGQPEVFDGNEWHDIHSVWHHVYRFMREHFEEQGLVRITHEDAARATSCFMAMLERNGLKLDKHEAWGS